MQRDTIDGYTNRRNSGQIRMADVQSQRSSTKDFDPRKGGKLGDIRSDYCEPYMMYLPKEQQDEGLQNCYSVAVSQWKVDSKNPYQETEVQFLGGVSIDC